MKEEAVNLITRKVTPLQNALLDWGLKHPYGKLREITFQDGVPVEAIAYTEDGTGTELIRFDKLARKAGVLK
jgi:hypothetical protein